MSDEKEIKIGSANKPKSKSDNQVPDQFIDNEFEIPTITVDLPSKGYFYPEGQDKVEIRFLTAESEDIMFSPELINSGKVLDVLLKEGIANDYGLSPDNMLVADRNAILIELRKTGFGTDYEPGEVTCPSCNKSHEPTIDLDNLKGYEAKFKPEIYQDEKGNIHYEYEVELPVTKKILTFRMLTGEDEKYLGKLKPTPGKSGLKFQKLVTERYIRQIAAIDGVRDKSYVKKFITMGMTLKDSTFFRKYLKEIEPGVDTNVEMECPHCGNSWDDDIFLHPIKLFYPDAEF